ncbi:MAG: hypothetical protein ACOC1F_09485 [Myxococcota bacterium]
MALAAMFAASCGDDARSQRDPTRPDAGAQGSVLPDASGDASHTGACFQRHLQEAIELNEARRPKYSALTGGRSEAISDSLIQSEETSLVFAQHVDEAAVEYQQAGIPIVCEEFVPMSGTPAFSERFAFEPEPLHAFEPMDADGLQRELEAAIAEGGYPALSALTEERLASLETPRAYHCMMRHMLESLRRVANLAPKHDARTKQLGLPSSLPLSEDMVRLHLLSIAGAAKLDEDAAPLQSEGVPILCQDVPPIPPGL